MYKAVDRKNKSEELTVYTVGKSTTVVGTWRVDEGVQICTVRYETTQIRTS